MEIKPKRKKPTDADLMQRRTYHVKAAVERGEIIRCVGCIHYRPLVGGERSTSVHACHYILDTGEPRGIKAKDCYKHEGTRYAPKEVKQWRK